MPGLQSPNSKEGSFYDYSFLVPSPPRGGDVDENIFVGIDISKDKLVVHVLPINQQLIVQEASMKARSVMKAGNESQRSDQILGGFDPVAPVSLRSGLSLTCNEEIDSFDD